MGVMGPTIDFDDPPDPADRPLPALHRSPYPPPIDDYAFLSDCETTCLIARNGAVEWMCVPPGRIPPRACSDRSSTAAPGISGSGRTATPFPPRADIFRVG